MKVHVMTPARKAALRKAQMVSAQKRRSSGKQLKFPLARQVSHALKIKIDKMDSKILRIHTAYRGSKRYARLSSAKLKLQSALKKYQ